MIIVANTFLAEGAIESVSSPSSGHLSPGAILDRADEAGRLVTSVTIVRDYSSSVGTGPHERYEESIYARNDYYFKGVEGNSLHEALYFQGDWFVRDASGNWNRQTNVSNESSGELVGHALVTVESSKEYPTLVRKISIGSYLVFVHAPSALARLEDQVINGRMLIHLRSAFEVLSAPPAAGKPVMNAKVTQDLWIGADDFLIYKVVEQAEILGGDGKPVPPQLIMTVLSGFNESELPGPLPHS